MTAEETKKLIKIYQVDLDNLQDIITPTVQLIAKKRNQIIILRTNYRMTHGEQLKEENNAKI